MKPLLIDLDGVLRIGSELAPHVPEFFEYLKERQIPACILSNTTTKSAKDLEVFFKEKGVNLNNMPILTALDATYKYAKDNYKTIKAYVPEKSRVMFADIPESDTPEAVVLGDLEDDWNYEVMNDIFLKVHNGAEIIAMQKNRYWIREGMGLALDAGPFVVGIEYATGKTATIMGKPSPVFFKTALKALGAKPEDGFYMLGDDLISDVKAAMDNSGTGIIVLTGKTSPKMLTTSRLKPDNVVSDLKDVIGLLNY